jgi:hypothetical protein
MAKATQKRNQMLVDFINNMNKLNMFMGQKRCEIQKNQCEIQETIFKKQLEFYFLIEIRSSMKHK